MTISSFDERKKRREFNARERSLFSVVINAIHTTAIQHMRGELDGRGPLFATFSNVLSADKRRTAFENQIALTRDELRHMVKAPLNKQFERLKLERTAELKHVRSLFDRDRQVLIQRQDEEWAKVREAWKQLKGRSYKPYQKRSADPVKKDWGKAKDWGNKADQSKAPKKAPRRSKDMGRTW